MKPCWAVVVFSPRGDGWRRRQCDERHPHRQRDQAPRPCGEASWPRWPCRRCSDAPDGLCAGDRCPSGARRPSDFDRAACRCGRASRQWCWSTPASPRVRDARTARRGRLGRGHELTRRVVERRHVGAVHRRRQAEATLHLQRRLHLIGGEDRHHDAGGAGAASAAGAVDVVLLVGGRIEVHDARDRVDVDATRGHVGGDEALHLAAR